MALSTKGLKKKTVGVITRRKFIKTTLAAGALVGMGGKIILPGIAHASKKKLKILQWTHTDSHFDWWLENYCKEWGEENDTEVNLRRTAE